MLKQAPSLARRAAVIFMSAYAAVFLAIIALSALASWIDRGGGNMRGPVLAIDYAAAELRLAGGRAQLPANGRFADIAARNPALWLVVLKDGRSYTFGAVQRSQIAAVARYQDVFETVLFRLPGTSSPLGVVAVRPLRFGPASVLIAAGGVSPVSLSTAESIDALLNPAVVAMLIGIAVIGLLAMLVAVPSFSRALALITGEAGAIGPDDPGRRLDQVKAPRELFPLVQSFNAALDRLEVELGRRKRFIADVAHELRTPLAVVSLRVEALDNDEDKADLRRGLNGLTHLVSQMLDLERLSLNDKARSCVDLVTIARDVVADLAPMAVNRGYDLSLTAPISPVLVRGDHHAIARAIINLVSNSVVHGSGVGRIDVCVGADRTIDVMDEGPGVPEHLRPRLFEPFVRGNANAEGCGLGLHIVREIMVAQNGGVTLMGGGGATFRLAFPNP